MRSKNLSISDQILKAMWTIHEEANESYHHAKDCVNYGDKQEVKNTTQLSNAIEVVGKFLKAMKRDHTDE